MLNLCAEYLPLAYRSRQAVPKAKLNSPYSTNMKISNAYFDNMVSQIYPSELQLNNANASDTEDLHLSISNDICPFLMILFLPKLVSEYDQEIPQSQTADNPMTPRGRATQPSQVTRKTT